jgi:glycosyl hydrolase family 42 (putative beta-galactosidase)
MMRKIPFISSLKNWLNPSLLVISSVGFIVGCVQQEPSSVDLQRVNDLGWQDFQPYGCEVERPTDNSIKVVLGDSPCMLILSSQKLSELTEDQWLSFQRYGDGPSVLGVSMMFWSKDNQTQHPDLTLADGLFPGVKARRAIPLKLLAEGRGIPKTPGSLIGFAFGRGVNLDEWGRMGIALTNYFGGPSRTVLLDDFQVTELEPDYPVSDKVVVDSMGQWVEAEWKDKLAGENEMKAYLTEQAAKAVPARETDRLSHYGGSKDKRFEASGFFRTQKDGDRWLLVDPEGYAFYSIGIDIVGVGIGGNVEGISGLHEWLPKPTNETYADAWTMVDYVPDIRSDSGTSRSNLFDFSTANLIKVFGENWRQPWMDITARRLIQWNVNTVGNWSDMDFARKSKTAYVMPMENFPVTEKRVFRDFPDVFSDEYRIKAEAFSQQLQTYKNDPYLIGYFMNNEPGWAYVPEINLAEELMSKGNGFSSKKVLIEFLSKRYHGDVQSLNRAWSTSFGDFSELNTPIRHASKLSEQAALDLKEFSTRMLEEYIRVPVAATKKIDPNHLNMGLRWASSALKQKWRFAGSQYLDVFSMNNYTDDPTQRLDIAASMAGDKPILIGEFHHGSMEAGHPSYGARWTKTEAERAIAYRYYAERAASHPNSIGIHYFAYNDDPVLGRFDGENFHHGFVTSAHKPYSDFIKGYRKVNAELYDVVLGKREPLEKYPEDMVKSVPMGF